MFFFLSKDYKKDIFTSLLYRFEPSHRRLQYKIPGQNEEEYALKDDKKNDLEKPHKYWTL